MENPFARALLAGTFRPGDTVIAPTPTVGSGTLVFSSERATVVTDAADRRDARAAADGEGAGAGAAPGGRRSASTCRRSTRTKSPAAAGW